MCVIVVEKKKETEMHGIRNEMPSALDTDLRLPACASSKMEARLCSSARDRASTRALPPAGSGVGAFGELKYFPSTPPNRSLPPAPVRSPVWVPALLSLPPFGASITVAVWGEVDTGCPPRSKGTRPVRVSSGGLERTWDGISMRRGQVAPGDRQPRSPGLERITSLSTDVDLRQFEKKCERKQRRKKMGERHVRKNRQWSRGSGSARIDTGPPPPPPRQSLFVPQRANRLHSRPRKCHSFQHRVAQSPRRRMRRAARGVRRTPRLHLVERCRRCQPRPHQFPRLFCATTTLRPGHSTFRSRIARLGSRYCRPWIRCCCCGHHTQRRTTMHCATPILCPQTV